MTCPNWLRKFGNDFSRSIITGLHKRSRTAYRSVIRQNLRHPGTNRLCIRLSSVAVDLCVPKAFRMLECGMCIKRPAPLKPSVLTVVSQARVAVPLVQNVLFGFNFTLHANPEQTPATWSNSCFSFSPPLATFLSEPYPHSAPRLGAGWVTMVTRNNKYLPLYYSTKKHVAPCDVFTELKVTVFWNNAVDNGGYLPAFRTGFLPQFLSVRKKLWLL